MNQINLMHRVDAGPQAATLLELKTLSPEDRARAIRGHAELKRRIARANREEDARQLQAALERLAEEG